MGKKKTPITDNTLDLHGVIHSDVEVRLENFLFLNEPPLTIITGNSDRMIHLVKSFLDKHNFNYQQWDRVGCYKVF